MIIDAALVALAMYAALGLRFEEGIEEPWLSNFFYLAPLFAVLVVASLFISRLYHRLWKYASIGELLSVIRAVSIAMLFGIAAVYGLDLPYMPRSVYIISWILIIAFIGASRLGWRVARDMVMKNARLSLKNALIIGAGDGGAIVARELQHNGALGMEPIGFIDDNPLKQKMSLYGIPVLGSRENIPYMVSQYDVEEIIIAMPSANGRAIRELLAICRSTPARVRIFNGTGEILTSNELRNVEMEDLLRRDPVQLNTEEIAAYISGRTILVSGAGGSIGSELCRQIAAFHPDRLVLLDNSENSLFEIEMELRKKWGSDFLAVELADIKNRDELESVYEKNRPQVVFHAAAYKHVPMMERHPDQAYRNNVLGTRNMAETAAKYGAETFIMVSTDKAVNPSSIMGASKRLAERIVQSFNGTDHGADLGEGSPNGRNLPAGTMANSSPSTPTRYAAVRFGNVLGSKGSVVPIFKRQIEQGGPVTVTDPEMTRYFMTIPEAAGLIIQAGALARGREIFVLDMGQPVRIVDLAEDLIRLAGLEPGRDIKMEYIGLRPGEKLHEELFSSQEELSLTRHEQIHVLQNGVEKDLRGNDLEEMWQVMLAGLPGTDDN